MCVCVCVCPCPTGVLIYFGYGMWHSTLEITAREEEAQASTYQRYDVGVDDGFADDFNPAEDSWGEPQDGGTKQKREKSQSELQAPSAHSLDSHRTSPSPKGSKAKSKGTPSLGFESLAVDDDLDDPLE